MQYSKMQCNAIQYLTMQFNVMQYNTIQYYIIQYNAMHCYAIQHNLMQYNIKRPGLTKVYKKRRWSISDSHADCLFSNNSAHQNPCSKQSLK